MSDAVLGRTRRVVIVGGLAAARAAAPSVEVTLYRYRGDWI